MSSRSLFNIIVKVFGLYLLKEALAVSSNIISAILTFNSGNSQLFFTSNILPFVIYSMATFFFIFHSDFIVDKLQLTKYTGDNIDTNIHRTTVLYIAIVILAGYIFVSELPQTCQYFFWYYRDKVYGGESSATFHPGLFISLSKIIISLLIFRYIKSLVLLIDRNRK